MAMTIGVMGHSECTNHRARRGSQSKVFGPNNLTEIRLIVRGENDRTT
jgi:hypothetical protein